MRRLIVVIPHLLSEEGDESVVRGLEGLSHLAELSGMARLSPLPEDSANTPDSPAKWKAHRSSVTPEAAWLGLNPSTFALQQGPLTISALGADPPDKSVHFHLSLMGLTEGVAHNASYAPTPEELHTIWRAAESLNTRQLTLVRGEAIDHGLVWEEGSIELGLAPARALEGKALPPFLPEGDGEPLLRRLIDDSVNLLSELPLNEERVDQGLPPFNLLWPWGPGFRIPVPNLALRRGQVVQVESNSLRLAGLARLAGYRHGDRAPFGRGLNTNLERVLVQTKKTDSSIIFVDAPSQLRNKGKMEELQWFAHELDRRLVQPLTASVLVEPWDLLLLAPGGYTGQEKGNGSSLTGLSLHFQSGQMVQSSKPFDERSLEDRTIPTHDAWELIDSSLRLGGLTAP